MNDLERENDLLRRRLTKQQTNDPQLSPLLCFIRGVQVGALCVGAANTIVPGQFGVIDWPLWLRVLIGGAFLVLAVHYLLRQRGLMVMQRLGR